MQHERTGIEHLNSLARQLRISAQVTTSMVRVSGTPHGHDEHVAPLGFVHPVV